MTTFAEDKLFKNINNKDARILLEVLDVDTVKVKVWTKELRLLDPKDYIPDIILKLDFENLIIELQSTKIDDEFSKRALTYVAVANRDDDNDKLVNLIVLTTAEESKTVRYKFSDKSVFTFKIVNLKDLDAEEIISTVEHKIKEGLEIEGKELVLYALIPMIADRDMEKYIKRVVDNLLQLKNTTVSLKNLAYGIEWLIVDKFVIDEEDRNVLCDALGDRMSLIYEYGERKENNGRIAGMKEGRREGIKEILRGFIDSGISIAEISQRAGKSEKELWEILSS